MNLDRAMRFLLNCSLVNIINLITLRSTQFLTMRNLIETTNSCNGTSKIELRKRFKTKKSSMKLRNSTYPSKKRSNKSNSQDLITIKLEINNIINKDITILLNNKLRKKRSQRKIKSPFQDNQLESLSKMEAQLRD